MAGLIKTNKSGLIPRGELGTMVDRLFSDFWNEVDSFMSPALKSDSLLLKSGHKFSYPKINVRSAEGEYVVEAAIPGLTKDEVRVEYANGLLTVSGASKQDESVEKNGYLVRELHKSSFTRSISVDEEVCDVENIVAGVENGVLTVKIPKKVLDTATPKRIIEVK